jgi:hypothetical protein
MTTRRANFLGTARDCMINRQAKHDRLRLVFCGRCVSGAVNISAVPQPFPLASIQLASIACGKVHLVVTDGACNHRATPLTHPHTAMHCTRELRWCCNSCPEYFYTLCVAYWLR